MGNFGRDDRGGRGGFRGGRRSFGGDRPHFAPRGGASRGRGGFSGGFGRRDDGPREMFDAVCDNCGKNCQVPFKPTMGKPIYCSDCFEKVGGRDDRGRSQEPRFDRPKFEDRAPREPRSDSQNKVQFDSLNAKLDKIISLLEANAPKAKVVKKAVKVEAPVEVEAE